MAPIQSSLAGPTGFDYWDAVCNGLNLGLNAIVALGVVRKLYKKWSNNVSNERNDEVPHGNLPGPRAFVNPHPAGTSASGIPDAVATLAAATLGSAIAGEQAMELEELDE